MTQEMVCGMCFICARSSPGFCVWGWLHARLAKRRALAKQGKATASSASVWRSGARGLAKRLGNRFDKRLAKRLGQEAGQEA